MKRRSCQYWNKQKKLGPVGCTEAGVCSDSCPDYIRRVKWAQWKVPLSQCLFIRYRYAKPDRYKVCAATGADADCKDSCPHFMRRKKKAVLKHNPHVPFYKGKKEAAFAGKAKSCKPGADHPWRKMYKRKR